MLGIIIGVGGGDCAYVHWRGRASLCHRPVRGAGRESAYRHSRFAFRCAAGYNRQARVAHHEIDAQAIGHPLNVPNVLFFARTGTASRLATIHIRLDINATTPEFTSVRSWKPTQGSFFTQEDSHNVWCAVLPLAPETYKKLFEPANIPLTRQLHYNVILP